MTNLDYALSYAQRGLYVFPLAYKSKRPLTANGFKDATLDEELIRYWWENEPAAGIAIATGASGLCVLDFDKKNGGLDTLDSLRSSLPETMVVFTGGGGRHYYYRGSTRSRAGVLPGLDIRSVGGYVVAPPSVHESGETYQWVDCETEPEVLPDFDFLKKSEPAVNPGAAVELPAGVKGELNKRTLRFLTFGAKPGQWHQEFFQAAMNLKQNGYTFQEAELKLEKVTGHLDMSHDIPTLLDVYENRDPIYPADLSQPETVDDPVAAAEVEEESPGVPLVLSANDAFVEFDQYLSGPKIYGESTGFEGLDFMLCGKDKNGKIIRGGLRLGEMLFYCAIAKTGKSTLFAKLIYNLIERRIPVGYASREMKPSKEVLPDLLSIKFQHDAFKTMPYEDWREKYKEATSQWPLYFTGGYMALPFEKLEQWVIRLKEKGVNYFFIDHLHICNEDSEDFKNVAKYAQRLKGLAQKHNVHLNVIVQPKTPPENQRLSMHSMRGGSSINQICDAIFILERMRGEGGALIPNQSELRLDDSRSKMCSNGSMVLLYNKEAHDMVEGEEVKPSPTDKHTLREVV